MTDTRTAYHARWVLPISSPALSEAAVVVRGATIEWIGPGVHAQAEQHVQLGNAALLPGLVNTHSHLELTVLRGFLEGLDFREWLRTITDVRRDELDSDALLDAAALGIREGLLAGITCYGDASASGVPLAAMRTAGVRGVGYLELFGPDPRVHHEALTTFQGNFESLARNDTSLVRTGASPHAPYTVSQPLFRLFAEWARAQRIPVAVHVAESAAEVAFVANGHGPFADRLLARNIPVTGMGVSPVELLRDTGLLDTQPLLVHAIHVTQADVDLIGDHGCSIAHCPISNAKLGHGVAPLDQILSAGIATGLGSDSVASNDRMDILSEARQATLFQSIRQQRPDALSAHDALTLATIGGARALQLDSSIGSLDPGKRADLAAFPLDRIEALPGFEAAVTLVHALAGTVSASLVLVDGVERVRDGRVLDTDPGLENRIRSIGDRLRKWRLRQSPMYRSVP